MKIGINGYPTYGGSGAAATELGSALAVARFSRDLVVPQYEGLHQDVLDGNLGRG